MEPCTVSFHILCYAGGFRPLEVWQFYLSRFFFRYITLLFSFWLFGREKSFLQNSLIFSGFSGLFRFFAWNSCVPRESLLFRMVLSVTASGRFLLSLNLLLFLEFGAFRFWLSFLALCRQKSFLNMPFVKISKSLQDSFRFFWQFLLIGGFQA